jgi:hypothetical protein
MRTSAVVTAALLVAAACVFPPTSATAGTTGVISGQVLTMEGHPLPGATVQVVDLPYASMPVRESDFRTRLLDARTTDTNGFFHFLSMEPGIYEIRPVLAGWNFYCVPRVVVFADQTSFIDLSMSDLELFVPCEGVDYYGPI